MTSASDTKGPVPAPSAGDLAPLPASKPTALSGTSTPTRASRSNSAVGGAAPNKARLPSLKQLSDRLSTPTSAAPPLAADKAAAALSEITTNVPPPPAASPSSTPSRLKLPASAISRAHLTGVSSVRDDAAARTSSPDGSVRSDKAKDGAVSDSEGGKDADIGEVRLRVGRGLGVGMPGAPTGPETPVKKDAKGASVPTTIVTVATPDKGASTGGASDAKPSGGLSAAALQAVRERGELPLAHSWTLKYDSKTYKPDPATSPKATEFLDEWEATLLNVGTFDSVQGFARLMNNVRLPGKLPKGANYHLFKDGIRPMWEDPANLNGGKWVVLFRSNPAAFDAAWANLVMGLVGEITDADDQVCGIVASARPKLDRIQVWTRDREDAAAINALGTRILEAMALDPREQEAVSMEFHFNAKDTAPPASNKFMRILSSQRSFTSAPTGNENRPRSGRIPSSPLATPSGFSSSTMPPPPVPPMSGSPSQQATPMRRTGSATSGGVGGNPFAGPMGSAVSSPRRLVSTPVFDSHPSSPRPGA